MLGFHTKQVKLATAGIGHMKNPFTLTRTHIYTFCFNLFIFVFKHTSQVQLPTGINKVDQCHCTHLMMLHIFFFAVRYVQHKSVI